MKRLHFKCMYFMYVQMYVLTVAWLLQYPIRKTFLKFSLSLMWETEKVIVFPHAPTTGKQMEWLSFRTIHSWSKFIIISIFSPFNSTCFWPVIQPKVPAGVRSADCMTFLSALSSSRLPMLLVPSSQAKASVYPVTCSSSRLMSRSWKLSTRISSIARHELRSNMVSYRRQQNLHQSLFFFQLWTDLCMC
jgi:hypothetical protein